MKTLWLVFAVTLTAACSQDDGYGSNNNSGNNNNNSPTPDFVVTATSSSNYTFNGSGFTGAADPELTLTRGETYVFEINASAHPFWIKTVAGTGSGNAFEDGVTNNGENVGLITFTVPSDAPDTLFYNCGVHSSMTNRINIID